MLQKDYKVILKGNWQAIRIIGKNKTSIRTKNLFVEPNNFSSKEKIKYYESLIDNGYTSCYALVKTILITKNITKIEKSENCIVISFDKDSKLIDKSPKLVIYLNTPELRDYIHEIMNLIIKNYNDSRYQFLDDTLSRTNLYDINILSVVSSYEENDGISTFNLSNPINENDLSFLYDILHEILHNSDETFDYDYNDVINFDDIYYVKDVIITSKDKRIYIELMDQETLENVVTKIHDHNKTINNIKVKKRRK